jgi:hypothetical protein
VCSTRCPSLEVLPQYIHKPASQMHLQMSQTVFLLGLARNFSTLKENVKGKRVPDFIPWMKGSR